MDIRDLIVVAILLIVSMISSYYVGYEQGIDFVVQTINESQIVCVDMGG